VTSTVDGIAQLALTRVDLVSLRGGLVIRVDASDGSRLLVVTDDSVNRQNIHYADRVVLTAGELDLVETDPRAGQIVAVEGRPRRLFHVVGEPG
jgi:hypothetical protein